MVTVPLPRSNSTLVITTEPMSCPSVKFNVSVPLPPSIEPSKLATLSNENASSPAPPLKVSVPSPPTRRSFPAPPVKISLPASPTKMSLLALPVRLSFPALPRIPTKPLGKSATLELLASVNFSTRSASPVRLSLYWSYCACVNARLWELA